MVNQLRVEFDNVLLSRLLGLLVDRGIGELRYGGAVVKNNPDEGTFTIAIEVDRNEKNPFRIQSPFEAGLTAMSGTWDVTFESEFRRTLKEYLPDQSFSEDSSTGDTRTILAIFRRACLILEDPTVNTSLHPKVVPLFPRRPIPTS